jgi:predicted RNA-binding protein YlxR (DUF448 family)
MFRFHRQADGQVIWDPPQLAPARGGYLHRELTCIELARKRGVLDRALKGHCESAIWELLRAALEPGIRDSHTRLS